MSPLDHMIHVYRELAEREAERGAAQMRDRYLLLAADAALTAGQTEDAEQLRQQLLQNNPHHLIRPYGSFAEAMKAPEVYSYLADLRGKYAPEEAEQLLQAQRDEGPIEAPPEETNHATAPEPLPAEAPAVYPVVPLGPEANARRSPRVTTLPADLPDETPLETPPADDETPSLLNVWVPTALFVVLLLAGLALAAYTFARPFVRF